MKQLLFSVLILCMTTMAFSQDDHGFKFGIQASPVISWMSSNNKDIEAQGINFGINFGMMGEYYFAPNYALTGGISYIINQGGSLVYNKIGNYLPSSTYSDELQTAVNAFDVQNGYPARTLPKGVKISRNVQQLSIPFGFKMRTQELGGSYLRGFAHLPVMSIDIVTRARADVGAAELGGFHNGEVIYHDIFPVGISIGGGLGVEYYPNDKQLSFVGGLYYNAGLIDLTSDDNTKSVISNVTIKLGVMF